jgi:hypothetical protein
VQAAAPVQAPSTPAPQPPPQQQPPQKELQQQPQPPQQQEPQFALPPRSTGPAPGTRAWLSIVLQDPLWRQAAACGGVPNSSMHITDRSGRLWGWQKGESCAFKSPKTHVPLRADGTVWPIRK